VENKRQNARNILLAGYDRLYHTLLQVPGKKFELSKAQGGGVGFKKKKKKREKEEKKNKKVKKEKKQRKQDRADSSFQSQLHFRELNEK
jgi:hypothetical protein